MGILVSLILASLAIWQIIEIQRHSHMPFFARARSRAQLYTGFFPELYSCGWCSSVWVGFFFAGMAAAKVISGSELFDIPAFPFAASRLANILNDITYGRCRTPNRTIRT